MRNVTRAWLIAALVAVIAVAGGAIAGAQCDDWSSAGCTRRGGQPDADENHAFCARGTGDCYECEYNCRDGSGLIKCAEGARTYCLPYDPANGLARMGYTL